MVLLKVRNLSKIFKYRKNFFNYNKIKAVNNINFILHNSQNLAIIGENGSGKSTLAKMLSGIINPSSGKILINNKQLYFGDYNYRSKYIRMIFQDSSNSLNPRQNIGEILDIPLKLNTSLIKKKRKIIIENILHKVGLRPDYIYYYPHMLAPGQKQRIGLARALILRPKIIVADEMLALLDISTRSQIVNLMLELQEKNKISFIYVTQHLGIIKHISDQIIVMKDGSIIEHGKTADVLSSPLNNLTQRLISSHFGEELTSNAWKN